MRGDDVGERSPSTARGDDAADLDREIVPIGIRPSAVRGLSGVTGVESALEPLPRSLSMAVPSMRSQQRGNKTKTQRKALWQAIVCMEASARNMCLDTPCNVGQLASRKRGAMRRTSNTNNTHTWECATSHATPSHRQGCNTSNADAPAHKPNFFAILVIGDELLPARLPPRNSRCFSRFTHISSSSSMSSKLPCWSTAAARACPPSFAGRWYLHSRSLSLSTGLPHVLPPTLRCVQYI